MSRDAVGADLLMLCDDGGGFLMPEDITDRYNERRLSADVRQDCEKLRSNLEDISQKEFDYDLFSGKLQQAATTYEQALLGIQAAASLNEFKSLKSAKSARAALLAASAIDDMALKRGAEYAYEGAFADTSRVASREPSMDRRRSFFSQIDANQDGVISRAEFSEAQRRGLLPQEVLIQPGYTQSFSRSVSPAVYARPVPAAPVQLPSMPYTVMQPSPQVSIAAPVIEQVGSYSAPVIEQVAAPMTTRYAAPAAAPMVNSATSRGASVSMSVLPPSMAGQPVPLGVTCSMAGQPVSQTPLPPQVTTTQVRPVTSYVVPTLHSTQILQSQPLQADPSVQSLPAGVSQTAPFSQMLSSSVSILSMESSDAVMSAPGVSDSRRPSAAYDVMTAPGVSDSRRSSTTHDVMTAPAVNGSRRSSRRSSAAQLPGADTVLYQLWNDPGIPLAITPQAPLESSAARRESSAARLSVRSDRSLPFETPMSRPSENSVRPVSHERSMDQLEASTAPRQSQEFVASAAPRASQIHAGDKLRASLSGEPGPLLDIFGGLHLHDRVTWIDADDDIPRGSIGTIVGFKEDRASVQFPTGTWKIKPSGLMLVGEERFGFKVDEQVTWREADAEVPLGSIGTVVGFTEDEVRVEFGRNAWNFKPETLSKLSETLLKAQTLQQPEELQGDGHHQHRDQPTAAQTWTPQDFKTWMPPPPYEQLAAPRIDATPSTMDATPSTFASRIAAQQPPPYEQLAAPRFERVPTAPVLPVAGGFIPPPGMLLGSRGPPRGRSLGPGPPRSPGYVIGTPISPALYAAASKRIQAAMMIEATLDGAKSRRAGDALRHIWRQSFQQRTHGDPMNAILKYLDSLERDRHAGDAKLLTSRGALGPQEVVETLASAAAEETRRSAVAQRLLRTLLGLRTLNSLVRSRERSSLRSTLASLFLHARAGAVAHQAADLKHRGSELSVAQARKRSFFSQVDANQDGVISRAEFIEAQRRGLLIEGPKARGSIRATSAPPSHVSLRKSGQESDRPGRPSAEQSRSRCSGDAPQLLSLMDNGHQASSFNQGALALPGSISGGRGSRLSHERLQGMTLPNAPEEMSLVPFRQNETNDDPLIQEVPLAHQTHRRKSDLEGDPYGRQIVLSSTHDVQAPEAGSHAEDRRRSTWPERNDDKRPSVNERPTERKSERGKSAPGIYGESLLPSPTTAPMAFRPSMQKPQTTSQQGQHTTAKEARRPSHRPSQQKMPDKVNEGTARRPTTASQKAEKRQSTDPALSKVGSTFATAESGPRLTLPRSPQLQVPAAPRTWGLQKMQTAHFGDADQEAGRPSRANGVTFSERHSYKSIAGNSDEPEMMMGATKSMGAFSAYSAAGESEWWGTGDASQMPSRRQSLLSEEEGDSDDNSRSEAESEDYQDLTSAKASAQAARRSRLPSTTPEPRDRLQRPSTTPEPRDRLQSTASQMPMGPTLSHQFQQKDVVGRPTIAAQALGVSKDAGRKTVTKAFREGARQLHPDKGGNTEDMQILNAAYQKLTARALHEKLAERVAKHS